MKILFGIGVLAGSYLLCLFFFVVVDTAGLLAWGIPSYTRFATVASLGLTAYYAYANWPRPVYVEPEIIPEPEPQPAPEPPAYQYPPRPTIAKSQYYLHGTANWDDPTQVIYSKYHDHRYVAGPDQNDFDGIGYYVGGSYKVQKLMHAITIAGTGQGKGVCLVLPNLLSIPAASWFVLDPKGENAFATARFQKECGQNVIILDPWGEQKRLGATHGIEPSSFNPLLFVRENPDEMVECCAVIANQLVLEMSGTTNNGYWEERAKSMIKTYLLHLVTARPLEEQHLGTLYRWLRLPLKEREQLWLDMHNNEACDELVRSGIGEFISMNPDEGPLPSIISTAQNSTTFLESTALRASLEKDGFNPYQLNDGKTTLYLCLPERFQKTHSRWLRLVVGVCLKACNHRADKRVTFLLDEFALLGKMTDVQDAYAFSRGQNVQLSIFAQSLTQLVEIYGEHGMNTFLSCARIRQFFGVYDLYTQKYLSEYLGQQTVVSISKNQSFSTSYTSPPPGSYQGTDSSSQSTTYNDSFHGRQLLSSEEVGRNSSIITLIDGHKMLINRMPYWSDIYRELLYNNATYMPKDDADWRTFVDVIEGRSPRPEPVFPQRIDIDTRKLDTHQMGLPSNN